MERLSFIRQYITMPRFVGAILPSSKYLAEKMIDEIDFHHAGCIVEYGPGTGVFTEKLIKNRKKGTKIFLFEYNREFYRIINEKYKNEPDVHIINDSAEHMDKYLIQYNISQVDYIVSGLPFASLPHSVSAAILDKARKYLRKGGKFTAFQYTLFKKGFIQQYFGDVCIKREVRNIPPAYVFYCSN